MARKPIKMRRRDLPVVEQPQPTPEPEVVRLEKIIEREPSADLTETEAQLRTLRTEVKALREMIKTLPRDKRVAENYRFYPQRGPDGLIERVDAVVFNDSATLLQRAAGQIH